MTEAALPDFTAAPFAPNRVRPITVGKHYAQATAAVTMVPLEPDVAGVFPTGMRSTRHFEACWSEEESHAG